MLIAQISDLHLVGPGEKVQGFVPVSENLARTVAYINALTPRPDMVLVTGDLLHDGGVAPAQEAARLLSGLSMPWYIVPGNHDDRMVLRNAFDASVCPTRNDEFIHYGFEFSGMRFIGLDTSAPGVPGGTFCQKRADWLERQLVDNRNQPTVLFMHHPPVKFSILETDEDGFDGVDLLGEVVGRFPCIRQILCGHTHLALFGRWLGVPVCTAPDVSGMRLALDLSMKKPCAFNLDGPAFLLHRWPDSAEVQSYVVHVRDDDALHLF